MLFPVLFTGKEDVYYTMYPGGPVSGECTTADLYSARWWRCGRVAPDICWRDIEFRDSRLRALCENMRKQIRNEMPRVLRSQ
jgi:hypothetical protein